MIVPGVKAESDDIALRKVVPAAEAGGSLSGLALPEPQAVVSRRVRPATAARTDGMTRFTLESSLLMW